MSGEREKYLDFLAERQPMPSDDEITDAEGDGFAAALAYFEEHLDDRCVPLFINAVSADTGLGMYKHITFVLMKQERSVVLKYLEKALQSDSPGTLEWSCRWAMDLGASELEMLIRPLTGHDDDEVRDSAASFVDWYAWYTARAEDI